MRKRVSQAAVNTRQALSVQPDRITLVGLLFAALLAGCGLQQTAEPTVVPAAEPTAVPAASAVPLAPTPVTAPTMVAEGTPIIEDAVPQNVTLSDIADAPDDFVGEIVVVHGDVTELLGPHSLTLNDASLLGGDQVLVVGVPEGVTGTEGTMLQVTGTVQRFDLATIERTSGYDLQDELFTDYTDQAMILAHQIQVISGNTNQGVTFGDIADDPEAWLGKMVTVRGDLADRVGPRSFTLSEPGLGTGSFLVLAQNDQVIPAEEPIFGEQGAGAGETVQVTGNIRLFDLAEIEQEIGFDLQDTSFTDYDNQPVIIAQTVNVIGDQAAEGQPDGALLTPVPGTGSGEMGILTVADIAGNPDQYMGQQVVIEGSIDRIFSATVFTLDEDALLAAGIDNDLLIVAENANAFALDDGWLDDQVQVTGTVRLFVLAEVEREFVLDLDDELVVDFEGRPAIIATQVTPVP